MTPDDDRDLRRLTVELGDQAPPTPTWDELRDRSTTIRSAPDPTSRTRRSPVLAIAVAVLVVVGIAGIFVADSRTSEAPTQRAPAAPPTERNVPTTERGSASGLTLPVEADATSSGLPTGGLPLLDLDDIGLSNGCCPRGRPTAWSCCLSTSRATSSTSAIRHCVIR